MTALAISNSELETAQRCWRKWYFTYYLHLGLREEDPTGNRAIGSRVHFALARYYEKGEDPVLLTRALVDADMAANPKYAEDIAKDGDLCIIMLEGYVEWLEETGADEDLEFLESEREVRQVFGAVGGVKVEVVGRLDQRVRQRSTGLRSFMDHKTGDFTRIVNTARIAQQFLHYDLLEYLEYIREGRDVSERTDGGIYNVLKKVKRTPRANPPFYMRHEVRHNLDELRSYWTRVAAITGEIVGKRMALDQGADPRSVVYPTPTSDCYWSCDFFPICPLVDDGSDLQAVIQLAYEEKPPRYVASEDEA